MSAAPELAPAGGPGRRERGRLRPPRLRLLPTPTPSVAGNGVFAAVVVAMVLAGMALLLVLNTSLAQGAFEQQTLQSEQSALQVTEQALQQQVDAAQSPEELKRAADRLGMVPVTAPVFLRLTDGKVLGEPQPARRTATKVNVPADGAAAAAGAATTTAVRGPEGAEEQAPPRRGGTDGAVPGPAVPGPEGAEEQAPPHGDGADAAVPDPVAPGAGR
ncbi:MAG TPA: hypothetical protein VFN19_06725 [Candidatus Nanopelagicales bacterium]|nr:hypothetical protein [Candidatus Nanopelagicales bacterium]